MLTKDLLNYRIMNGFIKPKFIKTDDSSTLDFAVQLLAAYDADAAMLRSEIDETTLPLIKSHKDLKLSRGLNKLILDRCEFSAPSDMDYREMRRKIFERSAELLNSGQGGDLLEYTEAMRNGSEEDKLFIDKGIYADLPENETLISLKSLYPRELLERYNCSLVQSLFFYCDKLEVSLEDPEASKMRKLLKYLKFFRLLAEFKMDKAKKKQEMPSKITLIIDGPTSLFENTQKYGLQLACFFPAVCDMDKWKIKADIKMGGKEHKLSLDQKSGLVSHYRNFSAFVPEEVSMFHKLFKEKISDWEITAHGSFINAGEQDLIFPDLSFKRASDGAVIHLELFHRWHSHQLLRRIEFCEKHPNVPLLIGVDRFLYNKPEIKSIIDSSEYFENSGFLFRDFPGVDRVKKSLAQKADGSSAKQMDFNF